VKKDERGNVINFREKVIPINSKGDPAFSELGCEVFYDEGGGQLGNSILSQFTPAEVVQMVNRYLYQSGYQRTVHRQRARAEAERWLPLKQKLRELFNVSHTNATEEQIEQAMKALAEERR
jgi:hypothetical protein